MKKIIALATLAIAPLAVAAPAQAIGGEPHVKVCNSPYSSDFAGALPEPYLVTTAYKTEKVEFPGDCDVVSYPSTVLIKMPKSVGGYRYKYKASHKYGKCHSNIDPTKGLNIRDNSNYVMVKTYGDTSC